MSRPVIWFVARDDRKRPWRVLLATPEMSPILTNREGDDDCGATDYESHDIFINTEKPRRTWATTLLHELNHVALDATGFARAELFIETHAIHFLPLAKSFGFRFPPIPHIPWKKRGSR